MKPQTAAVAADPDELAALWETWSAGLRRLVARKITATDVDDVLQEIFLKLQTNLAGLRDPGRIAPWLRRVAESAIADHYRTRSRWEELPEDLPAPESAECSADLTRCLHPMIDSLPETYREAVRLTEIEGLTQQAVADRLGLSLSGAKSRVQRGRARLRQRLLESCQVDMETDVPCCRPKPGAARCC